MKIRLISDSCCDLKAEDLYSEKVSFATIPLSIITGGKEHVDVEGLNTKELISEMKASSTVVKTACPPPESFAQEMRQADCVICLTISSLLSGSFNSATVAAETVKSESPEKKIFVIDSLSASAGMMLILIKIKAIIESGDYTGFEELCDKSIKIRNATNVRFVLQDLSNFIKTGRVSKIAGLLASIMKIKLILGENGKGEIISYGRVLSAKSALIKLAKFPEQKIMEEGVDIPIIITQCHNESDAEFVKAQLVANFGLTNIKILPMRGLSSVYANDKGVIMAY